jgi:hypothetical protein
MSRSSGNKQRLILEQIRIVRWELVRDLLKEQSTRREFSYVQFVLGLTTVLPEGTIYDKEGPEVIHKIESFIKTYEIDMNEVLIQKLSEYKTFNQFFSRKLKPTARPIDAQNDPSVIVSAADCRLNVFHDFTQARQFWCVCISSNLFSSEQSSGSKERNLRYQSYLGHQIKRGSLVIIRPLLFSGLHLKTIIVSTPL